MTSEMHPTKTVKRKITLTEDGALLLKRAEEIISLFDKTQQEITGDHANINGKISIGGVPLAFVRSGLGYLLTSSDHLPRELDADLCFLELKPALTLDYALVWKRSAVLSKAAQGFLWEIKNGESMK